MANNTGNGFILPLKSILLDKHERLNLYKETGQVKDREVKIGRETKK